MATVALIRQCSKCEKNVGTFNCEGCKGIFCTKHAVEHRQELSTRFEELMTEHNLILQQVHDKEQQNELSKKVILCRIDQWEKNMMEKVREKAEQVRQQLIHSMNNDDKLLTDNFQDMKNEICKRYETEDFFEQDLERIKQNIDTIKQETDKLIQRSTIKLHIEETSTFDWSRLIYVKEECITAASSVMHQQSTCKDNKQVASTMQSNQQRTYPYSLTSDTVHPIQQMTSPYMPPFIQPEKRIRKPLFITDPISNQTLTFESSNSSSATNRILPPTGSTNDSTGSSSSSSNLTLGTDKEEKQNIFRRQMAELFIDKSNK